MFEFTINLTEFNDYVNLINDYNHSGKPNLSKWLPGDWIEDVHIDYAYPDRFLKNRPILLFIKIKDLVPSVNELMRLCPFKSEDYPIPKNIAEFTELNPFNFKCSTNYLILRFILWKYTNTIHYVDYDSELYELLFEALNTYSGQHHSCHDTEGVRVTFLVTPSGELLVNYFDDNEDGAILRIDSDGKGYVLESLESVFGVFDLEGYRDVSDRLEELEEAKQTISDLNNTITELKKVINDLHDELNQEYGYQDDDEVDEDDDKY